MIYKYDVKYYFVEPFASIFDTKKLSNLLQAAAQQVVLAQMGLQLPR